MTTLKAFPNYIKSLGVVDGLRVFIDALRAGSARGAASKAYRVAAFQTRVHLRPTRADHSIFFQCLVKHQYELRNYAQFPALWSLYQSQLNASQVPLIIDCGGNIGLSAVWFATQFPQARIVVVEPDAENLAVMRLNLVPYVDRVRIVEGGVWSHPCRLKIINPDSGSAAFRVEEVADLGGEGLRAYSIDELCDIGGNRQPLIVKLDIEGSQKQLFSRNLDWIDRVAMLGLELDDWLLPWQGTSRPFFQALAAREFDYLLGGESIYCFNSPVLSPWHA
jgi:FkbM family methyltransferase